MTTSSETSWTPGDVVSTDCNGGAATQLSSLQPSPQYTLLLGANTLRLSSAKDGIYTLTVTRALPSVSAVSVFAAPSAASSLSGSVLVSYSGTLAAGVYLYVATVSYAYQRVTLQPLFATQDSVQTDANAGAPTAVAASGFHTNQTARFASGGAKPCCRA